MSRIIETIVAAFVGLAAVCVTASDEGSVRPRTQNEREDRQDAVFDAAFGTIPTECIQIDDAARSSYHIIALHSGKALSVNPYEPSVKGANVVQMKIDYSSNIDDWKLELIGVGGAYRIINVGSGFVMKVSGNSLSDGAKIVQWEQGLEDETDSWCFLKSTLDNYFEIVAQHSGGRIDIPNRSTLNGEPAIQWSDDNSVNQKFKLVPVLKNCVRVQAKEYHIVARHSGMSLSGLFDTVVQGPIGDTEEGDGWRFEGPMAGNFYNIFNKASGQALQVVDESLADGADVVLSASAHLTNGRWCFQNVGGGYYAIVAEHSGQYLGIVRGLRITGAKATQSPKTRAANQQFRLIEINGSASPSLSRSAWPSLTASVAPASPAPTSPAPTFEPSDTRSAVPTSSPSAAPTGASSAAPTSADPNPRRLQFLFSGQSNMEGVIEAPRHDLTRIIHILNDPNYDERQVAPALIDQYTRLDSRPATPIDVYNFIASEMVDLNRKCLIGDMFASPLSTASCSFTQAKIDANKATEVRAFDVPVSPDSACGNFFGPELMFSHVMKEVLGEKRFIATKFASGGSSMAEHWLPGRGKFWEELVDEIRSIDFEKDEWKAFVWFQGENEAYVSGNTIEAVLSQLTEFIGAVRAEMSVVQNDRFPTPLDVPVVIVQVGCWIQGLRRPNESYDITGLEIAQAQAELVANTVNAALVHTDDLSCHFHYDVSSQLIIGYRIAMALQFLLGYPAPPVDYC